MIEKMECQDQTLNHERKKVFLSILCTPVIILLAGTLVLKIAFNYMAQK